MVKSETMHDVLPGKSESAKPKLLDGVRRVLRCKHYSLRTEQAYVDWFKHVLNRLGLAVRSPLD